MCRKFEIGKTLCGGWGVGMKLESMGELLCLVVIGCQKTWMFDLLSKPNLTKTSIQLEFELDYIFTGIHPHKLSLLRVTVFHVKGRGSVVAWVAWFEWLSFHHETDHFSILSSNTSVRRSYFRNRLVGIHVANAVIAIPANLEQEAGFFSTQIVSQDQTSQESISLPLSPSKSCQINWNANHKFDKYLSEVSSALLWFSHCNKILSASSCPPNFFTADSILSRFMSALLFFLTLFFLLTNPDILSEINDWLDKIAEHYDRLYQPPLYCHQQTVQELYYNVQFLQEFHRHHF